ncbi:MAG: DUF1080 domain-containing protein [Planctomycetaceae bacterium]|nr:DUF1080 domain-containing protein [Planctomycetaceae bacterium]
MPVSCRFIGSCFLLTCFMILAGTVSSSSVIAEKPAAEKQDQCAKWIPLFDGKSLKGWTKTKFGSESEVLVEDKTLIIEMGAPITGVTMTAEAFKPLPRIDYEMRLKAKRELGGDFFVALTFPVNDSYCSLILGGWGGSVVGLSNLDGSDASENESTTYHRFKNGVWYDVRLEVTKEKIQVWLDKESVIEVDIADKDISTRIEMSLSHPIGLATFETTAHIQDFKVRSLPKKK